MLQRLILTRELENIPQLLICAEPLQGLDSATAKSFCEELRHFADNGAMIIVLSSSDFPQDICNNIYELARNKIKLYQGNYSQYLEKKETEAEIEQNTERRIESVLRFERQWLLRGPCARGTKNECREDKY